MMSVPDVDNRIEVDRIVNLTQGFGWKLTRQEFLTDKIIVQLEKSVPVSTEGEAGGPG